MFLHVFFFPLCSLASRPHENSSLGCQKIKLVENIVRFFGGFFGRGENGHFLKKKPAVRYDMTGDYFMVTFALIYHYILKYYSRSHHFATTIPTGNYALGEV